MNLGSTTNPPTIPTLVGCTE